MRRAGFFLSAALALVLAPVRPSAGETGRGAHAPRGVLFAAAFAASAPSADAPRTPRLLLLPGLPTLPHERIRFAASETRRCLRCHGMANFAVRDSATGLVRDLHVDSTTYVSSAHARLYCRSCHPEVTEYPHVFAAGRPKVACGADCHAVDRRGRPYSHVKEAGEFAQSAHGKGKAAANPDSPACTTCHGGGRPHGVMPVRRQMTVPEKMALCAGCHDDRTMMVRNDVDPGAVGSYRRSFHYKAIHFGARGTAVCQDCHGAHRILAKDDPASSIAAANLPKTCGQKNCHPGARMNFAMSGANHLDLKIRREWVLFWEQRLYILLIIGTLLALVAGVFFDVQRRLGWGRLLLGAVRALVAAGALLGNGVRPAAVRLRRLLWE